MSRVTRVREYEIQLEPLLEVPLGRCPWASVSGNRAGCAKGLILAPLALAWELAAGVQGKRPAARLPADGQGPRRGLGQRRTAGPRRGSPAGAVQGLPAGDRPGFRSDQPGGFHAVGPRPARDLTAMSNPLPAIALLPLALLWFGLGQNSLIFVLVHLVLWALALNTMPVSRCLGDPAHGRAQLRPARPALRPADPGAGRCRRFSPG